MSSSALSVADFIARWRAASSDAAAWSMQLNSRALTYFGSSASSTCSALGSKVYSGRRSSASGDSCPSTTSSGSRRMTSGSWVTIEMNRLKTMCTSSMPPSSVGAVKSLTSR